jgi:hypothetical protein
MGVQLRIAGIGGAVTLPLALASCDKNPSRPTPLTPANPPSAPTLARVEVTAPASIPPGQSVQLTAAVKSDGSTPDVTGQAQWGHLLLIGRGNQCRRPGNREASRGDHAHCLVSGTLRVSPVPAVTAGTCKLEGRGHRERIRNSRRHADGDLRDRRGPHDDDAR